MKQTMKTTHRKNQNGGPTPQAIHFRMRQAGVVLLLGIIAAISANNLQAQAQDTPAQIEKVAVNETRDLRFGEILVVKESGIEIYNTTGLNDCPAELWDKMDLEQIKKQFGAIAVQKNGPHFWMMDSQVLQLGKKVSFGGIEALPNIVPS
jgi:haloalkane dehalogenase